MGRRKLITPSSPGNEAKAREFMTWYGQNIEKLKYYVRGSGLEFDEDLFSDAFLRAYDAITRRGTLVKDYTGYFLQSYRATFLDSKRKPQINQEDETTVNLLRAPEFNIDQYERAVETINKEMLEYIREAYDPVEVSIFEIYVGLLPDISYKRMASILSIPEHRIWKAVGNIKKDVVNRFNQRKGFLLSLVEF